MLFVALFLPLFSIPLSLFFFILFAEKTEKEKKRKFSIHSFPSITPPARLVEREGKKKRKKKLFFLTDEGEREKEKNVPRK